MFYGMLVEVNGGFEELMETRWRKEGLGFLEERYENSSFLLADTDVTHGFGL